MTRTDAEAPPAAIIPAPRDDLCLGFANTRYWRGSEAPTEDLRTPDALLAWCRSAGVLEARDGAAVEAQWRAHPEAAAAAFGDAVALREAIYGIFRAIAGGTPPVSRDLDVLNLAFAAGPQRSAVAPIAAGYGWRVSLPERPEIAALLAPVVWSAADLLVGPRLGRVRHCANDRCQWLFIDDSKSGTRRWCSMTACGNRAKAHRHYVRRKGGEPG